MGEAELKFERDGNQGRFFTKLPGIQDEAEINFRINNQRLIATHTGVPKAFRGRGMALKLVLALVDYAKAEGLKIVPVCSYVKAQYKRHPEWAPYFA